MNPPGKTLRVIFAKDLFTAFFPTKFQNIGRIERSAALISRHRRSQRPKNEGVNYAQQVPQTLLIAALSYKSRILPFTAGR